MEKKSKFLGICILIAALLITGVSVFHIIENRYKVVGSRVFDTFKGMFVDQNKIDLLPKETQPTTAAAIVPQKTLAPEQPKGDISKVIIAGHSHTKNSIVYKITCTVQNNDIVNHRVYVKAIYYDKKNSPISVKEVFAGIISPNDIQSVTIEQMDNIENISSYDLNIIASKYENKGINWDNVKPITP